MLYGANGTVYIATRSKAKITAAIKDLKARSPASGGRLEPLILDLSDLATIKPAADAFLSRETRLDVLVHNAGVMTPPKGSKGAQGHELQMVTHTLGPFLLTRCLEARLTETARGKSPGSVRVVWVTSMLSMRAPAGGVVFEEGAPKLFANQMDNYMQSKTGTAFLAREYATLRGGDGIVSLVSPRTVVCRSPQSAQFSNHSQSVNPGLVKTDLQRHSSPVLGAVMVSLPAVSRCSCQLSVLTLDSLLSSRDPSTGRTASFSPPSHPESLPIATDRISCRGEGLR